MAPPKESSPVWVRALKKQQEWENKEEFLDVIYWMRQLLSIVLGVMWGIIPLEGFVGMLLYLALNAGIVYVYFALYQHIDEEEYGGTWELLKEGFMTSYALFLPLDVIYWMRQLLSIVLGVMWGIIPLEGFVGMLL